MDFGEFDLIDRVALYVLPASRNDEPFTPSLRGPKARGNPHGGDYPH
jgi:hypothetical protein